MTDLELFVDILIFELSNANKIHPQLRQAVKDALHKFTSARLDRVVDNPNKCITCAAPLTGTFYGAGDGTGQKFKCHSCYWGTICSLCNTPRNAYHHIDITDESYCTFQERKYNEHAAILRRVAERGAGKIGSQYRQLINAADEIERLQALVDVNK